MFEYTSRNKSDIRDSYTTEIRTCNYGYKDRTRFADSLEKRTENDLDKSIFLPNVTSRLKKKCDPRVSLDGPMAISFEKYVHNIFRPGITLPKLSTTFSNSINAHSMLRIHDLLGPAALNESCKSYSNFRFSFFTFQTCLSVLFYLSMIPMNASPRKDLNIFKLIKTS